MTSLRLVQSQSQSQHLQLAQLVIAGGASSCVFPAVEAWLQESTDHWNALRAISTRMIDHGYRSVVDFILAEVCPSLREPCLAFYVGNGPALRDMATVTEKELRYYECRMIAFLEIAYTAFSEKRRVSWSTAVELLDLLEVA